MKRELNGIKNDISALRGDVNGFKSDVIDLKSVAKNTAKALSRLIGDISDMKRNMATKDDISTLVKRMDGFTDMLQDSRWDWGKQKVRLDDHEKRIAMLEVKRA